MTRTVLITGATGTVSGAVLAALVEGAGVAVRAMVRDRDKAASLRRRAIEVVPGDLDDPDSLPGALEGVNDLWLLNGMNPRAAENSMNAIWAARQTGVERIVRLSALRAAHDSPTRNGRLHAMADDMLERSGLRWTIIRAHAFMQNLLWQAQSIKTRGAFHLNMGNGRLGMIDVRDVAELAARVLREEPSRHHGRIYTPTGPAAITFAEAAEKLGQALGRTVRYVAVTDAEARQLMIANGTSTWLAGMLVEYGQALGAGWGDFTTTDFDDVVGRPARSFADFARDYAGAFGARPDGQSERGGKVDDGQIRRHDPVPQHHADRSRPS